MDKCNDYGMFGMCSRSNCRFRHEIEHVPKQEFFIAQIISEMREDGNYVSLQFNQNRQQSKFFIGKGQWNRNGAVQGDLVVFQISTEQHDNVCSPRGRVFLVLSKDWSASVPCVHIAVKESAFTLDPINARYYDDALTIEDCKDRKHSGCKEIGIHIVVAATPQKVSVNDLSFYADIKISPKFRKNVNSLEKGMCRLAISTYLHTANDFVTEPEFSVVRVTENYRIFHDKQKYLPHMEMLWSHFKCLANRKIAKTGACSYLSSTPKIWKEFFILDELMAAFSSGVRKLIETLPEFQAHFITASGQVYQEETSDKILVPEEFFENALRCFVDEANYSDSDVQPLVAAGCMSQWMDSAADSLPFRYERDVEICSNLKKERVVKCTSPMRTLQHYLNQQILIRCMINEKSKLYEQTELLGILGIRFRTPKMLLAVVKTLDARSFTVNYNGGQSINQSICKINYATLCDIYEVSMKKLTIYLKKIFCEEKYHCTRSIVSCDGKLYKNFIQEFCGENNFNKLQQHFRDMEKSKERQVSTYTNADDGIIINLQLKSELQLQISNDDASENRGLGLRLLRIGRNCHLCLLHMNHPELAFMSDRKDIREQNLESMIKILTEMTTDEKLNTIQLKNVNIEWCDEYFSGGIFLTACTISPGDFLCIRKEIRSGKNREGDAEYVWNAHGIVVAFIEGNVKFSVCTLSQAEKTISDKEGFCVDIISTKQKK